MTAAMVPRTGSVQAQAAAASAKMTIAAENAFSQGETARLGGVISGAWIHATASPARHTAARTTRRAARRPGCAASVKLEGFLVVELELRVLPILAQEAVADGEALDFRSHEAAEGVARRAHDRLAAHVEAGVDQHRAAG